MWIEILDDHRMLRRRLVTPCAGVWIEIVVWRLIWCVSVVTPCAGVWIEMLGIGYVRWAISSLPVRECGLKYPCDRLQHQYYCHSLCGSVD